MGDSVRISTASALESETSTPMCEARTRFQPPSAITNVIPRPRLRGKLSAATQSHSIGLLCAPAGTGKTLLLADWARQQCHTAVSWLTLAERDNNAQVFCASLREALAPHLEAAILGAPAPFQLSRFMAAIAECGDPITLILDDVHALHDPISISTLDQVLADAPTNLSIVLAARYEPPLAWHRLALNGRLTRFDPPDLAFNSSEISLLLSEYDIALDHRQLTIIESFTKGWGAVVRLAATYLSGRTDTSDAVDEFTHTPRPVADFLVDEVLATLPPHLTTFMLRTSVVDAFSLNLAEALTNLDAATEISSLMQFNLPLTRTDSSDRTTWFTYHPLLREHLRAEFRRVCQDERIRVCELAATWFETHHHEVEALEIEVGRGDPARILAFLDRCGLGIILDGYGSELVSILESAPTQVSEATYTRLLLTAAALHCGDVTTASTYLSFLDGAPSEMDHNPLYLALTLEAHYGTYGSEFDSTPFARTEEQHCANSDIEAYAHLQLATGHFLSRNFTKATMEYTQSAALATLRNRTRLVLRSLAGLAFAAAMDGDIEAMSSRSEYALNYAAEHHLTDSAEYELSMSAVALAAYLRDDLDSPSLIWTSENCMQADVLGVSIPAFGWHTVVAFGLHNLSTTIDRRGTAASTQTAMVNAIELGTFPIASAALLPAVVNACLSVGELDWASRLIHDTTRNFGDTSEVHLARASLRLAGNRPADAQIELTAAAQSPQRPLLAHGVYMSALQSCIHAVNNQPHKAFHSLHAALCAAQSGNLFRPFLDYGPALREILDDFSGHFGDQELFAEQVRARVQPQELVHAPILTPGEYTVLRELASGDTTDSIATTLFVSVNTIKTHLRGIYRKLDVTNRRDALKAARRSGLI